MTDQELIRAIAEKVMGWVARETYWWGPDEIGRGWAIIPLKVFNPLTNANHRDMVVDRMREKYDITIDGYIDSWEVTISLREGDSRLPTKCRETGDEVLCWTKDENLGNAVCEAALKAVENG